MFFPNLKCFGCEQVMAFANQQLRGDLSPSNVSNVVSGVCNIIPSAIRGQVSSVLLLLSWEYIAI